MEALEMDDEDPGLGPEEPETPVARDFQLRFKPLVTTPRDELARIFGKRDTLEDKRIALEAQVRPLQITTPGIEVAPETVVKRTKAGAWSTGSAFGKIAAVLKDLGVPFKTGRSEYYSGDVVKAVKGKVEGKQTAQTVDYQLVLGEIKEHVWMNFPWDGSRAALRGTEITWRGKVYPYKEFLALMIGGKNDSQAAPHLFGD